MSMSQGVQALAPTAIDIANRQAVIDSYLTEFERPEPAMEFTGNVDQCAPGTTSTAYQLSVLQRVNWYRQMAGLPDVSYNSANYAAAQAGALISAAQGSLSHTPNPSAKCYTSLGYTGTSSSNLALGGAGVYAIDMYIDDLGDNNTRVGHRRWILSPTLRGVATGDIPENRQSKRQWSSNALYVFDTGAPLATRDSGISWPPPGYVPEPVVYNRWSYVRLGADFTNAQVTVTRPNGQSIPLIVENRTEFLGPGIVFTPTLPTTRTQDITYTVTITGVTGVPSSTITYDVTVVPINTAPRIEEIIVTGHPCTGNLMIFPWVSDAELDSTTYEFAGVSPDEASFTIKRSNAFSDDVSIVPTVALNVNRSLYTFSFRIIDSLGASRIETTSVVIPPPPRKTLCATKALSIKRTKAGTAVKWKVVALGTKPAKFVVRVGSQSCTTQKTTCTIKGLKKGRYTVWLTASRSGLSQVTTKTRLTLK